MGEPDPQEERVLFLETIIGEKLPASLYVTIWHIADKHADYVRTPLEAESSAKRNGRHDVYLSVALRNGKGTASQRVKNAEAAGLLALVADIDIQDPIHKSDEYPADEDAAMQVIDAIELHPTIIVHSGHGLQAWWLFQEPWRFDDDADKQRAANLSTAWQRHVHEVAHRFGYKLDFVGDLARVLRVSGTFNAKRRTDIVPVTTRFLDSNIRYTADDFKPYCSNLNVNVVSTEVDDTKRYVAGHPCPVCGGFEQMLLGMGERCWGYESNDGYTAFCTRPEFANDIPGVQTTIGIVYPHDLDRPCRCGIVHEGGKVRDSGPAEGKALANALMYLDRYRDTLRYVPEFNKWYLNTGKWWQVTDNDVPVNLGYKLVDSLYQQAADASDRTKKAQLADLAKHLDNDRVITAMVKGARTYTPIATDPDAFDQNDWHAVCANGILDLKTGDLLPHNPSALHSKHLGSTMESIVYDPTATCPNWLAFLAKIFPEADGQDIINYLQRIGGYTLTGNTREQCLFFLVGEGDNGKTTFTQAICEILGTYYDELSTDTLMSTGVDKIPTDIAKLVGIRGAFASENEQDSQLAEARIKKLTGGEAFAARFMRQDFFTLVPKFKIWLHTNNKPKIHGRDKGIWRRLRVIPFNYTFQEEEKIKDFFAEKLQPELSGILAWLVRGCLEWQAHGLQEPERIKQAWDEYRDQTDTLNDFIREYVFELENDFLPSADVFKVYSQWCGRQREKPRTQRALSEAISHKFSVQPILRKHSGRGFPDLAVQRPDG